MKQTIKILVVLSFILFHYSCLTEFESFNGPYFNVEKDLWQYYEEFEKLAAERGLSIDLNELQVSAEISNIHNPGVAGSCQFGSAINNHITIDQKFWTRSNNLDREFVVFHELGHCVLLREHDEAANINGICLSIMRSGTGNCRDAYNSQNKSYYIDELFGVD